MKHIEQPYKFTFHENVPPQPPQLSIWDECVKGNLTREQKDRIFSRIHSQSGEDKGYYRLAGYVFPFRQFMRRFLVKYKHVGWQEVWAFDKTCIRKEGYDPGTIIEIHEIPQRNP